MKKKNITFSLCLALFVLGAPFSSCNKPFVPPDLVGTWMIGHSSDHEIKCYLEFDMLTVEHLKSTILELNGDYEWDFPPEYSLLKQKIDWAADATKAFLEDLQTITIYEDGTFRFTYESFLSDATGTYEQENSYIFFHCSTSHYPEAEGVLFALSNGSEMEVRPHSLILMSHFLPHFAEEEIELIFGNSKPITGLESYIFFRRTSSSVN